MRQLLNPGFWFNPMLRLWMRRSWDRRARQNALFYVNSADPAWNEEEFFRSGQVNVEQFILNDMGNICQGRDPKQMRILEIGCGVGRMTRALAGVFGEVHGVDISREMVARAREYLRATPNAHVHCNSGAGLSVVDDLTFDFAFSFIVFQHIPSKWVIENYIAEVGRRLRPGSLFKFQVTGRPLSPNGRRNTWFGAEITESDAVCIAQRTGFEARYMQGAGTQEFWLWFFKQGCSSCSS